MISEKNKIMMFRILYAITLISLIVGYSLVGKFEYLSIERKISDTLPYLPLGLVGVISIMNPSLPNKAFKPFRKKEREIDSTMQRLLGAIWVLIFVMRILGNWT